MNLISVSLDGLLGVYNPSNIPFAYGLDIPYIVRSAFLLVAFWGVIKIFTASLSILGRVIK